jgi:hypothetical protein
VSTLDDFGKTGQRPTHPELLDWLAATFVSTGQRVNGAMDGSMSQQVNGAMKRRNVDPLTHSPIAPYGCGWSIKSLHRLMMTSRAYRQSSRVTAAYEKRDPDNRLFSRIPLRRLDAESLRDTLLSVAGRLDDTMFGPPDAVDAQPDGQVNVVGTAKGWRRSIYVLQRRTQVPTLLEDFDLPPMNPNCIERSTSIVAPQALHLMNNRVVHELATAFAQRVIAEVGADANRQIDRAYRIALSRPPTADERSLASATLTQLTARWTQHLKEQRSATPPSEETMRQQAAAQALTNLCHALMNSAEFLTVD